MESIQFLATTPARLADLLDDRIKKSIELLREELTTQDANDELLTRQQTCELLKIEQTTLYHWTKAGKIIAYGIGSRRYYKRSEIMSSLKQLKK